VTRLIALALALLLASAGISSARLIFSGAGGAGGAPITISAITPSSLSFTAPVSSGAPTGITLGLTMTSGSSNGATFALATHSGCASTDNASFAVPGTALPGSVPINAGGSTVNAASYTICLLATLAGATVSPVYQSFTLTGSGGATTISSVLLSNQTFQAATPNAPVGSLSATLTPSGSFTGTFSIQTTGTDHAGTPCNASGATDFQIVSGAAVETNGSGLSATSYPNICFAAAQSGLTTFVQAFTLTGQTAPTNSMTVASATGSAISNYPLQFGRPFLDGAIPVGAQQAQGPASVTAGVMTTSTPTSGAYAAGQVVTGTNIYPAPLISSQLSGTTGGAGTYQLSTPELTAASTTVTAWAQQCPSVLVNGVAPTGGSQADVKNRYPDGSVEFAVMSAMLPSIPSSGNQAITFQAGTCNNAPLSQSAMLAAGYNFDLSATYNFPAAIWGGFLAAPNTTLATWTAITNGGFSITIDGTPYALTGLNFSAAANFNDIAQAIQAGLNALSGLPTPAVVAFQAICNPHFVPGPGPGNTCNFYFEIQTSRIGTSATISYATAPGSGTDISAMLGWTSGSTPRITNGTSPVRSARTMLTNGNYTLWTSGPVAQTIILADDSTARAYDVGDGDGYHPLRPRIYATFWPATNQVYMRYVSENDLTTETEDMQYTVGLTTGNTSPTSVFSYDLTEGLSGVFSDDGTGLTVNNAGGYSATYTGNINVTGTPPANYNYACAHASDGVYFLDGTGQIFQGTPACAGGGQVSIGGRSVTSGCSSGANCWSFGTLTQPIQNGAVLHVGYPKAQWASTNWTKEYWLGGTPTPQVNINNNVGYMASTRFVPNFDASVVPTNTDITNEYSVYSGFLNNLYDATYTWNDQGYWESFMGLTGGRPDIGMYPDWLPFWLYTADWRMRQQGIIAADTASFFPANFRETDPTKRLARNDTTSCSPCSGLGRAISITDRKSYSYLEPDFGYTYAADSPLFVGPTYIWFAPGPFLVEAGHQPSPFFIPYLLTGEPYYLNEMQMWAGTTISMPQGITNGAGTRGPSGDYGPFANSDGQRAPAWALRNIGESAFATPDADPDKWYLTYIINDNLARYEGMLGISGTPYDGDAVKAWGASTGNPFDTTGASVTVPTTGNWEVEDYPNGRGGYSLSYGTGDTWVTAQSGSFTESWMHAHLDYMLGRLTELGFAANPVRQKAMQYEINEVLSAYPKIITNYSTPVTPSCAVITNTTSAEPVGTSVIPVVSTSGFTNGQGIWIGVDRNQLAETVTAVGSGNITISPALTIQLFNNAFIAQQGTGPNYGPLCGTVTPYTTMAQIIGAQTPAYLTGVGWDPAGNGGNGDLDTYFASNTAVDGRQAYYAPVFAMAADHSDTNAAAALSWYDANVYTVIPWHNNPKWPVVPRTDTNVLPAFSTASP
jgi:hypothetical protein